MGGMRGTLLTTCLFFTPIQVHAEKALALQEELIAVTPGPSGGQRASAPQIRGLSLQLDAELTRREQDLTATVSGSPYPLKLAWELSEPPRHLTSNTAAPRFNPILTLSTRLTGYSIRMRTLIVNNQALDILLTADQPLHESATECIAKLPASSNDDLTINGVRSALLGCLQQHGHPYGKCDESTRSDRPNALLLTPGPVMKIRRIRLAGSSLNIPEQRFWNIYGENPGVLFDATRTLRFKESLEKNQLLTGITVEARPLDDKTLELVVHGTPAGKNMIAAGVDYSADGVGLTGRWVHGGPDWLAGKIDSALRYRPQKDELFARMRIPLSETTERSIRSDLFAEIRRHPAYTITQGSAALRLTKPLTNRGLMAQAARQTFGVGFQSGHEESVFGRPLNRPTDALFSEYSIEGTEFLIPLRTHLTFKASATAKFDMTGENSNRLSTEFQLNSETPAPMRWTYAMKVKLSAIHSDHNGPLPLSEKLYLGGSADLRGYKLGALGSTPNSTGNIGGVTSWVVSPQLLRDMSTPWGFGRIGPFIDFGGISSDHTLSGATYSSAGLTAGLKTPAGYFEFSIGKPLSTEGGLRLYATLGQPF